jgi:hypothetical protein
LIVTKKLPSKKVSLINSINKTIEIIK